MRLLGSVAAKTPVAAQFATEGRFVTIHQLSDGILTMASFGKNGNLVAFVLGEICVGHSGQL
jgi:hypothetical protein